MQYSKKIAVLAVLAAALAAFACVSIADTDAFDAETETADVTVTVDDGTAQYGTDVDRLSEDDSDLVEHVIEILLLVIVIVICVVYAVKVFKH
jgi:opacity protein-like surface antigen